MRIREIDLLWRDRYSKHRDFTAQPSTLLQPSALNLDKWEKQTSNLQSSPQPKTQVTQ